MVKKTAIKVIKREERIRQEQTGENAQQVGESPQKGAREVVTTVTNWVNEFQQKRRDETQRAIKTLFSDNTRPSEA
ncbi:MAG: hypothetical protein AUG51_11045 [Acidobacteria bacterium 13_1_20CM_3_53_8]|nr:MAG: hypothetical protein AUG51_11045 [Acidobacteria bacterium 13_1_20CM_3_53_8]